MINFQTINSIDLNNQTSWENKVFLTFDIDWASDGVINDTIDLLEKHNIKATWFITHDTPVLERLRENKNFELGVHPNFNFILNGDIKNGRNAEDILLKLLEIVPEAKSVRSHSMTQSSYLLDLFIKHGLQFDCNHFIPEQTEIELKPWILWNNIIKVPYFWEDDIHCAMENNSSLEQLIQRKGLRVFDFHPVHVFLNTEKIERYSESKKYGNDMNKLITFRNTKEIGTRDLLIKLLNL
jgi:hypothetical protein